MASFHTVDRALEQAILALRRLPYAEYLKTAHWQRVRTFALEMAGQAYGLCSGTEALEVHHRTYARLGFERPEDVIALCHDCHRDHHQALVLRAIRATEAEPLAVTVADGAGAGGLTPHERLSPERNTPASEIEDIVTRESMERMEKGGM